MTRYVVRLVAIAVLIAGTGVTIRALGYSGHASVLGMLLAAALTFAPVLLALESISRIRYPGSLPPVGHRREDDRT
jgi:predicted membrane channel-forming protein YqfA (hemolysin III family)